MVQMSKVFNIYIYFHQEVWIKKIKILIPAGCIIPKLAQTET